MAITSRAKVKAEISTGTGSGDTTSMLIPLWDRPLLHIGGAAQDLDVVIVYVSASDDKSGFVEVGRYDGVDNSDPVLITGSIDQPPYRHVMIEIVRDVTGGSAPYTVKTATTISVESWGTVIH